MDDQAQDLTIKVAELRIELFAQQVKTDSEMQGIGPRNLECGNMTEWVKNYETSRS